MRVIAITTSNYVLNTVRLCRSLKRVHPACSIIMYIDHPDLIPIFAASGCESRLLPEINTIGVKRAKFFAYVDAIQEGGFLYLDADVIVLQKLDELINSDQLTACRDDLSECHFIENPARPWINRPELLGDSYFNSGVFYAPSHLRLFFENCLEAAKNDMEWESLIIPTKLYDNHFFCAKVAEFGLPIKFVSEYQFNWQGFRSGSNLRVREDASGNLYNIDVNDLLMLVHFAGIADIDAYIQDPEDEVEFTLSIDKGSLSNGILAFDLVKEKVAWWSKLTDLKCPVYHLALADLASDLCKSECGGPYNE